MSKNTHKKLPPNHNYDKSQLFVRRLHHVLISYVCNSHVKFAFVKIPPDTSLHYLDIVEFYLIKHNIQGPVKLVETDGGKKINRICFDKNRRLVYKPTFV